MLKKGAFSSGNFSVAVWRVYALGAVMKTHSQDYWPRQHRRSAASIFRGEQEDQPIFKSLQIRVNLLSLDHKRVLGNVKIHCESRNMAETAARERGNFSAD